MATSALRINMTGFYDDPKHEAKRFQSAIDMAAYADEHGFDAINMEEHHCADNGWLASPLTMAAMVAARTERAAISVSALLITLYDPVRLAEDIAVIDVVSDGRFSFIAGQGYRPIEYHAMDKAWDQRGRNMDFTIETLQKAWTGEPFDYKGQTVRVLPKPVSNPHPPMLIGGMSKIAAKRAARFGLPFYPASKMTDLEALYYEEFKKYGHPWPGFVDYPAEDCSMLFLVDDVDEAWATLGHHFLQETREYASWKQAGIPRPMENDSDSVDDIREQGLYEFITPEQCLQRFRDNPDYLATLHPLVGGMPLDVAWRCMELYVDNVLKVLKTTG